EKRIVLPGYSTLQDIVGQCIQEERKRLSDIIEEEASKYVDKDFEKLLQKDEALYGITFLKKDAKGFTYHEIQKEIQKKDASKRLYELSLRILPSLKISPSNIKYYASLVDYYSVDRLKKLPIKDVRLYLLCYCFSRHQKI